MPTDNDGNGTLTRTEFAEAMESLGLELTKTEMLTLFNRMDVDGSGRINYTELHGYFQHQRDGEHAERMRRASMDKEDAEVGTRRTRLSIHS